jgi:hypothetical protein
MPCVLLVSGPSYCACFAWQVLPMLIGLQLLVPSDIALGFRA